ncbi:MAG TPA: NUDIX domain-containing protein [Planctomycetota bacterium]|jgi:isopentenyldiphosphate isomerase|nr:NUDIX domain-containing protein [Planctomycetota bacterium]OQC21608.1 MAG: putative Nudix hydrolase YfcD [Planctomycetes bacterium ADurb.Bin069]HNR98526.1 NUDIX domain-containing protein [Planctomycetota bacterium]HNU26220.1 NUDIX domain-containing protein [Planctomycetota bacterium]HOE28750.1 NUDIX domain-containing protein [Planctomycetota bacterium]
MEEELYLVDGEDRVIGTAPRSRVRAENLLHRGVGILVCNGAGEIYVHRRTATKDIFPGLYDMFVGGAVTVGEDYGDAARRECAEELGVRGGVWERLFVYRYEGPRNRCFTGVYKVVYDGPIVHQAEEVAWGRFMPLAQVAAFARENPVVPDGAEIFREYLRRFGAPPSS